MPTYPVGIKFLLGCQLYTEATRPRPCNLVSRIVEKLLKFSPILNCLVLAAAACCGSSHTHMQQHMHKQTHATTKSMPGTVAAQ